MKSVFLSMPFLLIGLATQAQPALFPEVFTVTGVASDDTLNIRNKPSERSADTGDLYPHDQIEVIALSEDRNWGKIIWQEGNGWVSMRYLRPSPLPHMPDSEMPLQLACSGTEPFWSATLWPNRNLEFKDYATDAPASFQRIGQSSTAQGFAPVSFAFTAGKFTGLLERSPCSDGMSERDYGWQLRLLDQASGRLQLRSGCCQAALN